MPKVHEARPIKRRNFFSAVDIIIPFHGQYDKVRRLLESIFRNTYSNPHQICLVDDHSPNETFINDLNSLKTMKCLRSEKQKGFGGAVRAGLENTSSPYVVVIQSDCVVDDLNWLTSMAEPLLTMKDKGVRMVSPKTNNPLGGDERQKGTLETEKAYPIILDDTHLSMYCFMCHRELFDKVGGPIKSYPLCGYEDEEFAYRMRKHGYKQAIAGNSFVYHEGECTITEVCRRDPNNVNVVKSNRELALADIRASLK